MAELDPKERRGLQVDRISELKKEEDFSKVQRRWTVSTVLPFWFAGMALSVLFTIQAVLPFSLLLGGSLIVGQIANVAFREKDVRKARQSRKKWAVSLAGDLEPWTKGVSRDISDLMEVVAEEHMEGDLRLFATGKRFSDLKDAKGKVQAKDYVREITNRTEEFMLLGIDILPAKHIVSDRDQLRVNWEDDSNKILRRVTPTTKGLANHLYCCRQSDPTGKRYI